MTAILLNILFAFCVVLTIFLAVTVLWHAFVSVPFIPTPYAVVRKMVTFADIHDGDVVYDLGAGDARMLVLAKQQFPSITATGVEYIPSVWVLGKIRILLARVQVRFLYGDARAQDVSDADCIFLYLIPELMAELEEKFTRELRPGTRVVSYTFPFVHHTPVKEEDVRWFFWTRKMRLYVW